MEEKDVLNPSTTNLVYFYDSLAGKFRMDEIENLGHTISIIDTTTKIQYTINAESYECKKSDINPKSGVVGSDGQLLCTWEILHFGSSYNPTYVGVHSARGIDCDGFNT